MTVEAVACARRGGGTGSSGAISEAQSFSVYTRGGSAETAIRINLMNDSTSTALALPTKFLPLSPPPSPLASSPPACAIYILTVCDEKFNEMCPRGPAVLSYLIFDVCRYCCAVGSNRLQPYYYYAAFTPLSFHTYTVDHHLLPTPTKIISIKAKAGTGIEINNNVEVIPYLGDTNINIL